jgi:hypothetical protein
VVAEAERIGASEQIAGEVGGERLSISRGRADAQLVARPAAILGLVGRDALGGPHQHSSVANLPRVNGRPERHRELKAGEPLIAERPVAAVLIPPVRPAEPLRRVCQRHGRHHNAQLNRFVQRPCGVAIIMA